ncbi:MAG: hypothetical protein AB1458_00530 [Bacteroidota bacterium]
MAIYRFRVSFEEQEDVYREIDIKSTQTFEDLHNVIQVAINFDNSKDASFFLSDDLWRKGEEIVLRDDKRKGRKLMSKSKLAVFIEDPHQKFIYVFDYEKEWTLYAELIKILDEEKGVTYPKCTRSVGNAPRQYPVVVPPPDEHADDEDEPKSERIFTSEEAYEEGSDTPEDDEAGGEDLEESGEEMSEGEFDENASAEEEA